MFGYATDETEECMPLTLLLAHKLNYRMKELSRNGACPWIQPDSKSQVSFFTRKILHTSSFLCFSFNIMDETIPSPLFGFSSVGHRGVSRQHGSHGAPTCPHCGDLSTAQS